MNMLKFDPDIYRKFLTIIIFIAFKSALNDLQQTLTDHEKARGVTNPKINQILKLTDLFAKLDRDKMRSKSNSPSKF
jgi:hypothetical protein